MEIYAIHPSLVHFPIALLTAGFALDLAGQFARKELCFSKAGFYLTILGFLGTVAAFGSGYFLTGDLEGEAGIAKETHELFGLITLITVTITLAFRIFLLIKKREDSNLKYISGFLVLLSMIFVLYTGYLGGELVWNFMIGI